MSDADFRWQAFFQRCTEPLFLLNRQQYLLFVNDAFEKLTGLSAEECKRLSCAVPRPPAPDKPWSRTLAYLLTPPPEVLAGSTGRQRRLVPAYGSSPPCWWDIDYLPLADADGFRGLVGKITPGPMATGPVAPPLPEKIVNLRQRGVDLLSRTYLGGKLPVLQRLAEQVRFAGQGRPNVVLVGGAGSGKKTLARLIHARSPAREQAFATLDCRRLPAFAVGAMLWGESGVLARAPVGTFYLNEPAYLPRELQERLLRWLSAAGEKDTRPRLICGSRADLTETVRQGQLLDELFQALATFRIDVPPLKDRLDDLPHLADRTLQRLEAEDSRPIRTISPDAWEILLAYTWPGNLRELFDVLQGARRHAQANVLDAVDLPAYLRQQVALAQMPAARTDTPVPVRTLLAHVERRIIELALRRARGQKRLAAKLLSVHVPWLYKRLHELNLIDSGEKEPPEGEE
jgi:hypothetical protein